MNQQFTLFRRSGVYYCEDGQTGKQTSLRTKNESETVTLLNAKNESAHRETAPRSQRRRTLLKHFGTCWATTWFCCRLNQAQNDHELRSGRKRRVKSWMTSTIPAAKRPAIDGFSCVTLCKTVAICYRQPGF